MSTSGDTVLWTLVKDGKQTRAVVRKPAGNETELELRFICDDDDVRETKVYSFGAEVASAALQKRDELIKLGWVAAPGTWDVPGEVIWRREEPSGERDDCELPGSGATAARRVRNVRRRLGFLNWLHGTEPPTTLGVASVWPAKSSIAQPLALKPLEPVNCSTCHDSGWRCEEHPTRAFAHDGCGGAVQPCTCEIGFRIGRALEFQRTKASRTVVLWRLVKDGKELTAKVITNGPDEAHVEIELDGEPQPSRIYETAAESAAAADEERRWCLEQGWREVPPIVSET